MEKLVLFEIHDYMNEFPREHVQIFRGQSKEAINASVMKFAYNMYHNSGGTIRFIEAKGLEIANEANY